jgi:hypothetical protein
MIAPPDALIERACEQVGADDFGPDGWQAGFERLVGAIATDITDDDAVARLEAIVSNRLLTRLRIEAWWSEHGDEAAAPVESVVALAGLPRTGTTALHYVLALDPQFRYLRRWEIDDPVPPPDLATEADDPRRPTAAPNANVRHIATAGGPTEDGPIFALHFGNAETILPVPSFTDWWRGADHSTLMPYHHRMLRLLHSHRPPRHWLLKYPNFLFHIPAMVEQYPDVRFVTTHRDPTLVVASTCSVMLDARRKRLPHFVNDEAGLGPVVLDHLTDGVTQGLVARERVGEERFLDLAQRDLESDPLGTAERVYDHLGLPLDAAQRAAIEAWAVENRRGARGTHEYSLEQFGLTDAAVVGAFGPYLDRFGELCG